VVNIEVIEIPERRWSAAFVYRRLIYISHALR